ncbi:MAG: glycosyltransferase [bacterium]
MIVGYPGFQSVILARFLTTKPLIFDAFLSMFDSMVLDRKKVALNSFRAKYFWWLDKISMSVADLVLIDTNEHKKYLSKEFGFSDKKIERVFIGADTDIFTPKEPRKSDGFFRVLFFGTYIPLQGIEYIIKAAKKLETRKDIKFEIIGKGQEKDKILKLTSEMDILNINFVDSLPQRELQDRVAFADVCLGIFGNTEKTKRVIPNKVYECVAMKKAVITADTLAERELFDEGELFFVKVADADSIVEAIIKLKENSSLLKSIAVSGYNKFTKEATPNRIGIYLLEIIKQKYGK